MMALPDLTKLKRYVALVIKFDPRTGKRAGNIKIPEDKGLFCCPLWQDLEAGIEMRLVLDDRDIGQYRGVDGIEVVEGKAAINAKVRELFKPRYSVTNPELLTESIRAKRIRIDDVDPTLPPQKQIEIIYGRGALGIRKDEPFILP